MQYYEIHNYQKKVNNMDLSPSITTNRTKYLLPIVKLA